MTQEEKHLKLRRNFLPDICRYEEVSNELHRFRANCEGKICELVQKLKTNQHLLGASEAKVVAAERRQTLDKSLQSQSQLPARQPRKKSSRILASLMVSQDRLRRSVKFEANSELQEVAGADSDCKPAPREQKARACRIQRAARAQRPGRGPEVSVGPRFAGVTAAEKELNLIENVIMKTKTILTDTIHIVLRARNFGEEGCLALSAKLKVYDDEEVHPSSFKVFDEHFEDLYLQLIGIEVDILRAKHRRARQVGDSSQNHDRRAASTSLSRSQRELRGILHSIPASPKHIFVHIKAGVAKPSFYLPIAATKPARDTAHPDSQSPVAGNKRAASPSDPANTLAIQESLDLKDKKVAPRDLRIER